MQLVTHDIDHTDTICKTIADIIPTKLNKKLS